MEPKGYLILRGAIMDKKIVECRIVESKFRNIIGFVYDDGTVNDRADSYYPDELHFEECEFIGLTETQARYLINQRDAAYLRS
jgi:hypothetical protein